MARGDHLFYYRAGSTYSHHGICCGDGTVVHYESSLWQKLAGVQNGDQVPTIKRVSRAEFSLGSPLIVRPYLVCDAPDFVLRRALSRLGEASYDLFDNNCEHFAVWCKTGQPHSTQVEAHLHASRALIQAGPIGMRLLSRARQVVGPSRAWAFAGTAAVAGSVYLGTYLAQRRQHRADRHS